ncbi:hypothetical protein ABTX15_23155 [Micromonospora sp. NPDC094482]|uniref:hypothetical protein n=1 Tax=unclassified Micromonospora TaxID=2617518 RepID=UPI00332D4A65
MAQRRRGLPERYTVDRSPGDGGPARPGVAPGARRSAGVGFAALYGELARHPWRQPDADQDPYFLFYTSSLAMGWLDDIGATVRQTAGGFQENELGAAGLWGMNDAGEAHPLAAPGSSLVAWFQVGFELVPGDRPLPVQPFLRCAGDAVARMGTLRLRAVQMLLPVQGLDPSSRPPYAPIPSLRTAGWFTGGDPGSRTPVRVTLDSGQAASIPSAAPQMREQMSRLDQDVFGCESLSLIDHDPLTVRPPFDDALWNGPSRHRATFHGTLAEWSLDALGWLGGFLADLSARHGVSTPLLVTASRS